MPLPDVPMLWLNQGEAIAKGFKPFAGFFLPHEYFMLDGFIRDLKAAKREYCGVRDTRHCKGITIYAKDGIKNLYPAQSAQKVQRLETYKTDLATEESIKAGQQEAREAESNLRETETGVASGTSDMRSGDNGTMLESVLSVSTSPE